MVESRVEELRKSLPQCMLPDWVRLDRRLVRILQDRHHPEQRDALLERPVNVFVTVFTAPRSSWTARVSGSIAGTMRVLLTRRYQPRLFNRAGISREPWAPFSHTAIFLNWSTDLAREGYMILFFEMPAGKVPLGKI